ncbi:AI-2E family transporter [Nocardioides sp. zg-536]|uniref:AI-2E family transporter n=1 Tax=Nocardioides faecalis TaxID=2803858 RepID=A0A938Y646_9ACTN|nr:AI-2E family transporter [Nocardioides faecalis]MBM9460773.1 AI-2E family transporter [Nocardioides faecalis]MBS4752712.1 AI-2E family transporter [Nocardioides faecalis]QVI57966.1 AI-2E family transporter [Nocardioides faecalis]
MNQDRGSSPSGSAPNTRREDAIGRGIAWTATWSCRWILIAIGAWILGTLVAWTWPILLPVAIALVLSTVLAPLAGLLRDRARLPRALAAGVSLIAAAAVLVLVGFLVVPSVADQVGEIATDASAGIDRLQTWAQESNYLSSEQVDALLQSAEEKLQESATEIASGMLAGLTTATNVALNLVLALILCFLFIKDGDRFIPWLRGVGGQTVGAHLAEVATRSWNTLGGFIRTQAVVSAIDAFFIWLGLVIIGVPLAVPLAIITFFAGFVPIVGAFAAGGLAVLVALVSNGVSGALWTLLVIAAVQQVEGNLLSPLLQSKSMNLHAAVVLLSVTLGGSVFGIPGAFLAVPVVAVLAVVLRYLNEQVALVAGEVAPQSADGEAGATADT